MPIPVQGISAPIDANPTGFLSALSSIERATKDTFGRMGQLASQVTGPLDAMKGRLGGIVTAVVAVTATIGKAVSETAGFTRESMELGRALGANASVGSTWLAALQDIDVSTGDLQSASNALLRQVRENEAAVNAMGVVTRTASGELRSMDQIMLDAITTVNSYKEGTDRNLAAQTLMGKGMSGNSNLLKLNTQTIAENAALQQELGLIVGERATRAYLAYDNAMDRANLTMKGLWASVGQLLIPVLTKLAEWFADVGPRAAQILRGALAPFVALFHGIAFAAQSAFTIASAAMDNFATGLQAFGDVTRAALRGDWSGAQSAWSQATAAMEARSAEATARVAKDWQSLKQKLGDIYAGLAGTPDSGGQTEGKSGSRSFVKPPDEKDAPSIMSALQAQLEARRYVFEKENEGREFSKAQELAFWRETLETTKLSTKDKEAVVLKFRRLEVEVAREAAKQLREIDEAKSDGALRSALAEIDAAEAAAEGDVRMGRLRQTQLLALQREFNEARLVEELEHLERKRAVLALDPDRNLAALEQLEQQKAELREKYAAKGAELARAQAEAVRGPIQNIMQTFQQGLTNLGAALLTNWRGVGSALRGILTGISQAIIQEVVTKPLTARVAAWAKEKAMTLAGIGADAAKAGSGAAASQASIPIVGPALAIAAMAALLAAVGGMAGKVPSAAGGFDIPKGMNPITQLHEREMVLPATLADTVRNMADQGGGGAPRAPMPAVELKAARMGNFFLVHQAELTAALRTINSRFALRP